MKTRLIFYTTLLGLGLNISMNISTMDISRMPVSPAESQSAETIEPQQSSLRERINNWISPKELSYEEKLNALTAKHLFERNALSKTHLNERKLLTKESQESVLQEQQNERNDLDNKQIGEHNQLSIRERHYDQSQDKTIEKSTFERLTDTIKSKLGFGDLAKAQKNMSNLIQKIIKTNQNSNIFENDNSSILKLDSAQKEELFQDAFDTLQKKYPTDAIGYEKAKETLLTFIDGTLNTDQKINVTPREHVHSTKVVVSSTGKPAINNLAVVKPADEKPVAPEESTPEESTPEESTKEQPTLRERFQSILDTIQGKPTTTEEAINQGLKQANELINQASKETALAAEGPVSDDAFIKVYTSTVDKMLEPGSKFLKSLKGFSSKEQIKVLNKVIMNTMSDPVRTLNNDYNVKSLNDDLSEHDKALLSKENETLWRNFRTALENVVEKINNSQILSPNRITRTTEKYPEFVIVK